jgi:hypothetical protein
MKLWIAPFAVAALATGCTIVVPAKPTKDGGVATADGGASTAGGGVAAADGGVACTIPQPGDTGFCQAATNLTANQVASQTSLCTSMKGTVVEACPDGAVGCCAFTSGSVDFDQCFYRITAATGEETCTTMMGTWTAGAGTSDAGATD